MELFKPPHPPSHTLDHLTQLGLDPQRATNLANKLHAHSVCCACKLNYTRRALENVKLPTVKVRRMVLHGNPLSLTSFLTSCVKGVHGLFGAPIWANVPCFP